ncbi:hypothetical protein COT75_00755 [Candidatus Beckwithbacteria bacterium CG10_big_fil_rev_8_21_14_0_10_34_10]|uniref:Transglycosylase SLT domain-containing protein n=1 Tax=Candidatus Beckwithbacteria bacterium CG10_big_fil_rev_8_21_14_0_10_34_10 TaxID=1974495 RepID=A0A2H0WAK9_9BACT|nr:MAG: hypothetical protein COT75_00755 [Candidatus Beckwithbacteria bacterium CG10_big_fil_rev_8_21_14_0_10_34_10]
MNSFLNEKKFLFIGLISGSFLGCLLIFKLQKNIKVLEKQEQKGIEISYNQLPNPSVLIPPSPSPSPSPIPTPKPSPSPLPSPSPSPEPKIYPTSQELDSSFAKYATEYRLDLNILRQLASCESGFNTYAVNNPYAGLYQFNSTSWINTRKRMGLNPDPDLRFNWEESIKTAAFKISQDGLGSWPSCQNKL